MTTKPLDTFGKLVMTKFRDEAIEFAEWAIKGHWKAPGMKDLQASLKRLTPEQKDVAIRLVRAAVDTGVHSFLFALQEDHDNGGGLAVTVGGVNVAAESDGLHGEPFTEDGWQARFSKYGQAPEID